MTLIYLFLDEGEGIDDSLVSCCFWGSPPHPTPNGLQGFVGNGSLTSSARKQSSWKSIGQIILYCLHADSDSISCLNLICKKKMLHYSLFQYTLAGSYVFLKLCISLSLFLWGALPQTHRHTSRAYCRLWERFWDWFPFVSACLISYHFLLLWSTYNIF